MWWRRSCSGERVGDGTDEDVNIHIIRTFVKLREMMVSHKDLARKLNELEKKYDGQFQVVFEAIRQLIEVEEKPRRKIGDISEGRAVYRAPRKRVFASVQPLYPTLCE